MKVKYIYKFSELKGFEKKKTHGKLKIKLYNLIKLYPWLNLLHKNKFADFFSFTQIVAIK